MSISVVAISASISQQALFHNAFQHELISNIQHSNNAGPAGTVFYDSALATELRTGKLTKSALDRLSVILMAGIAAVSAVTVRVDMTVCV